MGKRCTENAQKALALLTPTTNIIRAPRRLLALDPCCEITVSQFRPVNYPNTYSTMKHLLSLIFLSNVSFFEKIVKNTDNHRPQ